MKSALDHADAVLPGPTSKLSVLTEADKQLTDYELFEKYMGSVTDWGDLWEDAASLACVALRAGGSLLVFLPWLTVVAGLAQACMPELVRYLAGSEDLTPPGNWAGFSAFCVHWLFRNDM